MSKLFSDDEIVDLYKQSATETPTEVVDKRILNYAKKKSSPSWYKYASLAAIVSFVAILLPKQLSQESKIHSVNELSTLEAIEVQPSGSPKLHERKALTESEFKSRAVQSDLQRKPLVMENEAVPVNEMADSALSLSTEGDDEANRTFDPFISVVRLLAKGERENARIELKSILTKQPNLRDNLSEELERLLTEESQ